MPFAQALKQATGVTTIAVGLITQPKQAEEIVASGKADMVALARGMLYDPRWGWHAAAELGGHVEAPPQYWRSQPSTQKELFGNDHLRHAVDAYGGRFLATVTIVPRRNRCGRHASCYALAGAQQDAPQAMKRREETPWRSDISRCPRIRRSAD